MRRCLIFATLGSLLSAPAADQKPSPEDQKRVLDTAREIALHYTSKLPDFICTEQVQRGDNAPGRAHIDRLTIQLSYNDQKEHYKLVTMNGSPTTQSLESLGGLITAGEFGSQLAGIFNPASAADFHWKESATLRKRGVSVYTYKIARANSHYNVGHRGEDGNMIATPAAYHGEVFLDSQTSHTLRLTAAADDLPKDWGILTSSVEVDYDYITVAGKSYLLPSHSGSNMERDYRKIGNNVTFTGYRKFEADSTIDFGK
jgi:hypothetical protein